jgi:serine/threonine-protein kinase SRPK3
MHCTRLLTHFVHPGIDDDGEHLCFVTELFLSNVQYAETAWPGEFIPIPTVKRILRHLLLGLVRLHKCGVAHTGMTFASLRNHTDDYLLYKVACRYEARQHYD